MDSIRSPSTRWSAGSWPVYSSVDTLVTSFYYPEDMADDPAKFAAMFATLASEVADDGVTPASEGLAVLELRRLHRLRDLVWVFFKKNKLDFAYDPIAHGLMTGWMLGRFGCFVAHDHPGIETNFWLGVADLPQLHGNPAAACHDLGLYEAFWSGAMAIWFSIKDKVPATAATTWADASLTDLCASAWTISATSTPTRATSVSHRRSTSPSASRCWDCRSLLPAQGHPTDSWGVDP